MSAARTASRSQQAAQTPGASVMQTPGSLGLNPSQQLGTGLRGAISSQPTPASMRRPDLGHHYVGFRAPPASAGRRTSLAPSVSGGATRAGRRAGQLGPAAGSRCSAGSSS